MNVKWESAEAANLQPEKEYIFVITVDGKAEEGGVATGEAIKESLQETGITDIAKDGINVIVLNSPVDEIDGFKEAQR